jgi:hypothetical protein
MRTPLNLQSISRKRHAVPLLVLAPDGLALNIDDLDYFRIPWNEVRDVTASTGRSRDLAGILKLRNGMIDHIRARRGSGRGWSSIFIMHDDDVYVALHHSILPVSRADLCTAVEARWHAFGGTTAVSGASVPR